MEVPSHLTPGPSGMSMSSLTPGRDLEDIKCFDMVADLDKTFYKQDKTSSQTISPIVESNSYITTQGLT